jgi:outer membrane protein OmpA-like peptidoglycan-associated protein
MKKLIAIALAAGFAFAGAPAHAAKHWDDMSWWGNTGATPAPVADSQGRSGYWWWPTEAASNVDDGELWGNRGIVYHSPWEQAAAPEAPIVEPGPAPAAAIDRQVPVLNNILFDFDKSVLKPEGQAVAGQAAGELQKWFKDTVVIEGHTCNVGSDTYNMGLGERRANSVVEYIKGQGIDASRLSGQSFGETTPAVPNDTAANRKLNRRAVLKFSIGTYAPGEVQ